jgi:hypothetical protein
MGAALFLLLLAACRPTPAPSPASVAPPSEASEAGYVRPPQVLAAARTSAGVRILGQAPPNARVRLAAPDGTALGATARDDGSWSLVLPLGAEPRMFSLAAEQNGLTFRSDGAVIAAPGTAYPVIVARAGAAGLPAGEGRGGPVIVSVDYDGGGGASVGGLAAPGAAIRLTVDGAQAGQGQADPRGRFAVAVTGGPVRPGVHAFAVQTPAGADSARVELSPPAPLQAPFRAVRANGGWRIDWAPPGGGVQTALVLDQGDLAS